MKCMFSFAGSRKTPPIISLTWKVKSEELMQTEAFLVYKDSLTDYLRNFIAVLQRSSFQIEKLLQRSRRALSRPLRAV